MLFNFENIVFIINIIVLVIIIILFYVNINRIYIFIIIIIYLIIILLYIVIKFNENKIYYLLKNNNEKIDYCPNGCDNGICDKKIKDAICINNYECNYCINKKNNEFILKENEKDYNKLIKKYNIGIDKLNNYIEDMS